MVEKNSEYSADTNNDNQTNRVETSPPAGESAPNNDVPPISSSNQIGIQKQIFTKEVNGCANLVKPINFNKDVSVDFFETGDLEVNAFLGSSLSSSLSEEGRGVVAAGAPGANALYIFAYEHDFIGSYKPIRINLSSGSDFYNGKKGSFGHAAELGYLNNELHLVIGAPFYNNNAGAAFIIKVKDILNYNKEILSLAELPHVIIEGKANDELGFSVAIKENLVLIGVPGGDFGLTRNPGILTAVTAKTIETAFLNNNNNSNQKKCASNDINQLYFTIADRSYGFFVDLVKKDNNYYLATSGIGSNQCVISIKFSLDPTERNINADLQTLFETCKNTNTNFGYSPTYFGPENKLCVGEPACNNFAGGVVCNSGPNDKNFDQVLIQGLIPYSYTGESISYNNGTLAISSPGEQKITIFYGNESYVWKLTGQDQTYFGRSGSAVFMPDGRLVAFAGVPQINCKAIDSGGVARLVQLSDPSSHPSAQPSSVPSSQPSSIPTVQPSSVPSSQPSAYPSSEPSSVPSSQPSSVPTIQPSSVPSSQPSSVPIALPSSSPSAQPTQVPSACPSAQPSAYPSTQPSSQPSSVPTASPSSVPSAQPTAAPSTNPSAQPSAHPSTQPSGLPTSNPSGQPSTQPSGIPSSQPSSVPSSQPSVYPSSQPSSVPSSQPSVYPSSQPSSVSSSQPSSYPTALPSSVPSAQPTKVPSAYPSAQPSAYPSTQPSSLPSSVPSGQPSSLPSALPSAQPSSWPTTYPSSLPSAQPSTQPSSSPSALPSAQPSSLPSSVPTSAPTKEEICHVADNPFGLTFSCSRFKDMLSNLIKLVQENIEIKNMLTEVTKLLHNSQSQSLVIVYPPAIGSNKFSCGVQGEKDLSVKVLSSFNQTGNDTCVFKCVDHNDNVKGTIFLTKEFMIDQEYISLIGMCEGGM